MIKIVTDSTCDLPSGWLARLNITVVPVNIQFGAETFREGFDISPAAFYQRINSTGALPTTSQPSVGEYCQIYEQLAADGSDILSVHLTSQLSGTWQTATLAARQLSGTARITVIDSHTGSVGLGLMVREAAQLVAAGLTVEQIAPRLEARRSQIFVAILLKDLRYARMSGRVGRVRETFASLLNVQPIIGVDSGALIPLDRVRGQHRGFERMVSLAEAAVGRRPVHMAVAHAVCQPQAEALLELVAARLNCRDTFIAELATSLAVHFGPGAVGFAAYPAE